MDVVDDGVEAVTSELDAVSVAEDERGPGVATSPKKKKKKNKSDSPHKLETPWSMWYDRKLPKGQGGNFEDNLKLLGTFDTVEGFLNVYRRMQGPHEFARDVNCHCFRHTLKPMWETFPNGGCWLVKIDKRDPNLPRMWESLLMAAVGEMFGEPDLVGVELSRRTKENVLAIWNADNRNTGVRFHIGDKMKEILNLSTHQFIEYKANANSLKDQSTFRNAKPYVIVAAPAMMGAPVVMMPTTKSRSNSRTEEDAAHER